MSKEFRLGLFIVGTLLILTTGVFLIGSKQFLFRRTYRVKADFPNVGCLIEGGVGAGRGNSEGNRKED